MDRRQEDGFDQSRAIPDMDLDVPTSGGTPPQRQILADPSFAAGGSTGKKCPSSLASSSGGPAAIDAGRPAPELAPSDLGS